MIEWNKVEDKPLADLCEYKDLETGEMVKGWKYRDGWDDLRLYVVELEDKHFEMFTGTIQDETTCMLDSFGDDTGWSLEDVTHWAEINLPDTDK